MKILLYFQDQDRIKKSGIGRALRHQIKALTLNGIEYTLDPDDDFDLAHINTYFGKSQRVLKRIAARGKPIIVHGHSTFEDFAESFRAWRLIQPYYRRSLKKMYSQADLIVTPTPYSKRLIESYPFVSCPVIPLSNGIDIDEYEEKPGYIEAFRKHFGLAESDRSVIGIGWFFHRKGLEDFIETARRLPEIKFIWFGHQPRWQTQPRILRAIRSRPANVIFPGYIDGAVIKGAMHAADLLFFPSYEETEGIVVLEAMASHLPVLVRDIGVYDDWLTDGVDCRKATSVDEFAELIGNFNKAEGRILAEAAYREVAEKDLKLIGAELKKIYHDLLINKKQKGQ